MMFSDATLGQGIVQQTRSMMRVDSNQWPTSKIVASANNYLDRITGYQIGADRRFQFDDTNHTKLPTGTTGLTANQKDYSFLTDAQGNRILTLTRIDMLQKVGGDYAQLQLIDQAQVPHALDEFYSTAGIPQFYDKIADNIIRLYPKPATTIAAGLRFYFQRTPSYFVATDTTKQPGVSPLLHRGFVIAAAYDGALTLGLTNIQALAVEMQREENLMIKTFATTRNADGPTRMTMGRIHYL